MARASVNDVKAIFNTDLTDAQIQAGIDVANVLVTQGPATSTNPALSTDELKQCEIWLAAHFASIRDPIALRERVGDSEQWSFPASVTTAFGQGLRITVYGQQAIAIDRSGKLAGLGRAKGSFRAVPREDSDNYTANLTKK